MKVVQRLNWWIPEQQQQKVVAFLCLVYVATVLENVIGNFNEQ